MKKNLLVLFLCMIAGSAFAQQLTVRETIINPSNIINDGMIQLAVEGGQEPYTYKWSNQSTHLTSPEASGLIEGRPYSVTVTDANGVSVTKEYTIKAESITEILNSKMVPAVNAIGSVLFWDPFAAFGIHDPVMYAEQKNVGTPGWQAGIDAKFVLKEWKKAEGARIEKGELIAVVTENDSKELEVFAPASGTLKYLVEEGEVIYNADNKEHVIEEGAHYLAQIKYDEPQALLHPNGDKQQKGIPFIVVWLVVGAIFFTFRMGFINLRGFRHAIDLAKGKYDDPNAPGQVTHFQALATAVSGTVGLGNIAGVAVAISIGGAGATFWMIIAGLLGMSSKFVECTLGVKYRFIKSDGRVFGGPMNYLRYGLEKRGKKTLGKVMAGMFAVLAIGASFGGGNMFQANQSFEQLSGQFPMLQGGGFWFGIITAILVGVVIIGGINSIAKVTGKIVPIMASVYIVACLAVIFINIENLGPAFGAIFDGAFSPTALKGGVIGVLITGFQRAAFSNEAGVGSAAIAHSTAKTNNPHRKDLWHY